MKKFLYSWLLTVAILLSAIILYGIYLVVSLTLPCQPTRIERIEVGHNRSISIYEECGWQEISTLVYYDAREAGNVVVPISVVGRYELGDINEFTFEVVQAEEQSLVGVYDTSSSYTDLFIIVDFKTGESWPQPTESYEVSKMRKRALFKRLQKENLDIIKLPTSHPPVALPTAEALTEEPTPTNTLVIQVTATPSAP